MKDESQWDITRTLKLESLKDIIFMEEIENNLLQNEAIKAIKFSHLNVSVVITYDASKIGLPEIFSILKTDGVKRKKSIWQDFKYYCYQYTDNNRKDNATNVPVACCNKAPSIVKNKK